MPPTGSPDKEPGAPNAALAHILLPMNSLTNSPTSSSGSGSMLDWTTSAGSSDMFDLTSPPNTYIPVLVALPTPPSTAHDASPGSNGAAPPHIAVQPPTSASDGGAPPSVQTAPFTINWDELTFPTDWISPSPSVAGETRISRPSSTAPSTRDAALPRELVDKAFAVLHRLSEDDIAHEPNAESGDPVPVPAQNRNRAVSPSANSRREVTSVGTPNRRPSPVPTILNEDEEGPPPFQSYSSSDFNFFVGRDAVVDEDDGPGSDYYYQQLRPSDSAMMPPLVPIHADETPEGSMRPTSANSGLSYSSPPLSPRIQHFVDAFRRMGVLSDAGDREAMAASAASRPSTRSSSPPSPQVLPSSDPTFTVSQNQLFSPTRSVPVGSILSAAPSTEPEARVPKPQCSSASLASLLQSYSSLDASTILQPEPSRGRQRYRREFPHSTMSPAIQPSGLPSYAQTESTAASSVNLVPPSPAAAPMSSFSSWVPPQSWTGMSVTQPLAASEPLTKYGRIVHPLPPTPPIPSQTGNMFTSQPLFWTEPIDSSTSGSVATDASGSAQRVQRQRPPLPPVPVDLFAQSAAPPAQPMSAYAESIKFNDRTYPAYTETLPSLPTRYMPPIAIPSGFQPWASNGYSWSHARAPWSPLAHNVSGINNHTNNLGQDQNDHSSPLYSTKRRVWSPLSYSYPPVVPPIAPQPVPAPAAFMSSPATYGHSDGMSAMMNSPNVSATSPFIPSLNDIDAEAYSLWTGHPAPTGVRFMSPLPSPSSATPSTPRPAAAEFGRQPWAHAAYHTGEREDRERRQFYDSAGVRFAPPVPPPPPSSYARDERDSDYNFYAPVIPVIPPHLPPMPPASSVSSESQWTTNSRRYAFTDASVAFKVEQTLFKVHRSFFERHSSHFRRILAGYSYGSSIPITLPDVKKLDFERLLSIFYPSDLSKPDITTLKGWLAVLALSQKWEMDQIKRLCVRHIGHLAWPMEKVIIAHKYGLHNAGPSWLFAAYKEVCTRSVPLALRDAEQLSMELVVSIWEVQHEVSTMRLRGESIETTDKRVEELVKEKFGHFEVDTPPTTPTGRMPSFSSW